jgi:hypothetical protein
MPKKKPQPPLRLKLTPKARLVSFGTRIPGDTHRRLKVFCAMHGVSIGDVVTNALDEFLAGTPDRRK